MTDELSDLRLFTRIVAAGSLSGAARRSNMSLASISRRLSSMEDRLEVRLIDRGSRKFAVTEEGLLLAKRATPIIEALDSVAAELDVYSGTARGRLRVSAPNAIGRNQISTLCREFTATHPGVSIELTLTDERPSVLADDLDVAIVTKQPADADVIHRKLLTSRRVICASPSYLEARGHPERPEDLQSHDCIRMARGIEIYDKWTVMGSEATYKVLVSGSMVSNSGDNIRQLALDGAGIAVKALWDIERDIAHGRLIELLKDNACDEIKLYATYGGRRHVPLRIRLFINYLVERLTPRRLER